MTTNNPLNSNNQISFRYFHCGDNDAGAVEVFTVHAPAEVCRFATDREEFSNKALDRIAQTYNLDEDEDIKEGFRVFIQNYQADGWESVRMALGEIVDADTGDMIVDVFFVGIPYGIGKGKYSKEDLMKTTDALIMHHANAHYTAQADAA